METAHQIHYKVAQELIEIESQSIDLVVTSPPYPMIQMWDELYGAADPAVADALSANEGDPAFELMHRYLDVIWFHLHRVLRPGGIACINIGDATRSINGKFKLFANHSRIIEAFLSLSFSQLPAILWRKPTNAPNKFMGSGMLPPNAYVTLEHEYILVFRKNGQRPFSSDDQKANRRASAYFWEERNVWFSDVWFDLRGTLQSLKDRKLRLRSGAFPLELPYRLINMYSVKGDTVLDPFMGTGTTMQAAMCAARNCIGYEMDPAFQPLILKKAGDVPEIADQLISFRLQSHMNFINDRIETKGSPKYQNQIYGFPVITRQEMDLRLDPVRHVQYLSKDRIKVIYADDVHQSIEKTKANQLKSNISYTSVHHKEKQLKLF